jgi:hypothetical protein
MTQIPEWTEVDQDKFICLFNDACSVTKNSLYIAELKGDSEWSISKYLEGSSRGPIWRDCFSVRLEDLRKPTKTLSQNSRSAEQDYAGDLEYEAWVLTTRARRSVDQDKWSLSK